MFGEYRKEAEIATRAVALAVGLVREIQIEWRALTGQKGDLSPVTAADYVSQAVISHLLEVDFPDVALVAEEGSAALLEAQAADILEVVLRYVRRALPEADRRRVCAWIDRGAGQPGLRTWVLDPIDGTKGFLRGEQYVVALALIEDGQVVLGAMGCPNFDLRLRPAKGGPGCMVVAARDQGTWLASTEGKLLKRLQVSEEDDPSKARLLRSVESDHTDEEKMAQLIDALGIRTMPVRMDSQAKHAVLASGEADLMFRLNAPQNPDRQESIWDQAPGFILVEEAGGRVSDLRGAALDFTSGRQLDRNYGVLVSNGRLHEAALRAVALVGADTPPEAA